MKTTVGGVVAATDISFDAQTGNVNMTSTSFTSNSSTVAGVWTFLTLTYDAGLKRLALYVNGSLDTTATLPAGVFSASGPVDVGASRVNGVLGSYMDGDIDDVRLYAGVLSDQQIVELANV